MVMPDGFMFAFQAEVTAVAARYRFRRPISSGRSRSKAVSSHMEMIL
jgi:hypothetical protein